MRSAAEKLDGAEPMIGGLLRLLSETVRDQILRDVEARGYEDITRAQLAVFQSPSPDGVAPSVLATRAHMTKQSMNYLLGELEDRGYLERRPTAADGRARVIFLTARGKRLVKAMRTVVREIEETWGQLLGRDRFEEMKSALAEVHQARVSEEGVN